MKLEIFDVEHGQCSLLTGDAGTHMLIDAGHNATTGWRPSTMLAQRRIATLDRLVITNLDEDHASDLHNVLDVARVRIFHRNRTVGRKDIYNLKGQEMGKGIEAAAGLLDTFTHPVASKPDFGQLEIKTFWNRYPADFDDENNLSILTVLTWPNFAIAYPGDLEVPGWDKLLERQDVRDALRPVNVLVASHHGRMNGYTPDIFQLTGMQPELIVVSDSGIDYETQKTGPLYRKHASGVNLGGETRRVLTTRRDGTITFNIRPTSVTVARAKSGPPLF